MRIFSRICFLALSALLTAINPPPAVAGTPIVSGPGACGARAVDNASFLSCNDEQPALPASAAPGVMQPIVISAQQARRMKADLGSEVLLVDIRSRAEVIFNGMPLGFDVHVSFMEPAADYHWNAHTRQVDMDYNIYFARDVDAALLRAGMKHSQPVVLLCRTGAASLVAAETLAEYGYEQVFVVRDGFEGTAQAQGGAAGWKMAGLPWSADIEPAWLYHTQH